MTFVVAVLSDEFALVAADRRAHLRKGVVFQWNGVTHSVTDDEGVFVDGLSKVYTSDDDEGLVTYAGTNAQQSHIASGKYLVGFARDEHIHAAFQKVTNYADYVNQVAATEFMPEACLHLFRQADRFYATHFHAFKYECRRRTYRNLRGELLTIAIGSGQVVWDPVMMIPSVQESWKSLEEKAKTGAITPAEVREFLRRMFAVASMFVKDVSAAFDAYVLTKTGIWTQLPDTAQAAGS